MAEKPSAPETTDTAVKKKSPLLLIVAVIVVALLAVGFVAVKKVSAKSGGAPKKATPGPVMTLDEFLVNLADPGGDHFLKVTVGLELDKDKGKTPETLKDEVAPIRDAILMTLSSKSRADIAPVAGREKLKTEIAKKVNAALGEDDIQGVYFTNFVMQ